MIKWHKLEVGEQDRGKIRTEIKSRAENEASNTHSPWNSACLLKLGHRHYCEFLEGNLVCCKTRSARKRCRSIKPQLWVCNKIFLSEIQGLTQKKKKVLTSVYLYFLVSVVNKTIKKEVYTHNPMMRGDHFTPYCVPQSRMFHKDHQIMCIHLKSDLQIGNRAQEW